MALFKPSVSTGSEGEKNSFNSISDNIAQLTSLIWLSIRIGLAMGIK